MQALGGHHVLLDALEDRLKDNGAGADLVGQGREAEGHAFAGVALGLTVQRLMLAELLEQDHRQQVGAGPAARRHVEGRGRLGDRLAVPAGELLADVLDHLPLARDHLQRLGDVLAQLGQASAAATAAGRRRRLDDALTRQVLREGPTRRSLAG